MSASGGSLGAQPDTVGGGHSNNLRALSRRANHPKSRASYASEDLHWVALCCAILIITLCNLGFVLICEMIFDDIVHLPRASSQTFSSLAVSRGRERPILKGQVGPRLSEYKAMVLVGVSICFLNRVVFVCVTMIEHGPPVKGSTKRSRSPEL